MVVGSRGKLGRPARSWTDTCIASVKVPPCSGLASVCIAYIPGQWYTLPLPEWVEGSQRHFLQVKRKRKSRFEPGASSQWIGPYR